MQRPRSRFDFDITTYWRLDARPEELTAIVLDPGLIQLCRITSYNVCYTKLLRIVGAGGLGSPVTMYLAAAGVGHIGIVDNDKVSLTNLQRQILYNSEIVGKAKVTHAQEVLKTLNPNVSILPIFDRLTESNAASLIQAYDVVVDATDNFRARFV